MKRFRALLALLMAALMLLAACGSDDDDSSAPAETDTETEGEGEPKAGGILTLVDAGDINTLDPHRQPSFQTHNMAGLVYSRLIKFETGEDIGPTEQRPEPDLATSWEVSDDGLTYTFKLRDDVKWQNVAPVNGRPFVADDVVATFERIRTLPGFQRYMLEEVASITAPDEHTVVITLSKPFAPLLNFMANHHMWILPREGVDGKFDLASTAIGTGPFILKSRTPNVETIFEKNPDYYVKDRPYLDGIRRLTISDQGARIAAFRNGEAATLAALSPEELENVKKTNPDAVIDEAPYATLNMTWVNVTKKPFDDLRVRKAISLAIDRKGLGEAIFGEGGEIPGVIPPAVGKWALPKADRERLYRQDIEEAKKLLADAGHPNGFETSILTTPGYGAQVTRVAEWIAEDLKAIGIQAKLDVVEYANYVTNRWPKLQYDMAVGLQTPFLEPDEWLRAQLRTGASRNWYGISDPELDAMLDEQRTIIDEEERVDLVHEIQTYVATDLMNPIPLWSQTTRTPRQPFVKGWNPIGSYGYPWMEDVWIDKE